MKKRETMILIVVALIILAVVVAVSWDYIKYTLNKTNGSNGSLTGDGDLPSKVSGKVESNTLNWNLVLKKGVNGDEVRLLQQWANLVQPGKNVLIVDGKFGNLTETKLFQLTGRISITLNEGYTLLKTALTNA